MKKSNSDIIKNNIKVIEKLLTSIGHHLECPIKKKTRLKNDLGLGSIDFIKLLAEIEKYFQIEFPDNTLDYSKYKKINDLLKLIKKNKT